MQTSCSPMEIHVIACKRPLDYFYDRCCGIWALGITGISWPRESHHFLTPSFHESSLQDSLKMANKVLICRFHHSTAFVRMFCLPWVGGGSTFYSNWGKDLPASIEVHGVMLAGREGRFNEKCKTSLSEVLDEICTAIYEKSVDRKPFFLFGHSLGALLAFEVARKLKAIHDLCPVRMILSGTSAPHSSMRQMSRVDVNSMSEKEFLQYIKSLGGTPKEVMENEELMALFIPALRADHELLYQIGHQKEDTPPLECPIDIFDGKDDKQHDLKAWGDLTSGPVEITLLNGGHFYLKDQVNIEFIHTHILHKVNKFIAEYCNQ